MVWFSSMLLLAVSFVATVYRAIERKDRGGQRSQADAAIPVDMSWALIAFLFPALSWDELGSIHEHLKLGSSAATRYATAFGRPAWQILLEEGAELFGT